MPAQAEQESSNPTPTTAESTRQYRGVCTPRMNGRNPLSVQGCMHAQDAGFEPSLKAGEQPNTRRGGRRPLEHSFVASEPRHGSPQHKHLQESPTLGPQGWTCCNKQTQGRRCPESKSLRPREEARSWTSVANLTESRLRAHLDWLWTCVEAVDRRGLDEESKIDGKKGRYGTKEMEIGKRRRGTYECDEEGREGARNEGRGR